MDRQSHYTWTLTRDEITDVWYALTHYAEYWESKAKKAEEIEAQGKKPRGLTSYECREEMHRYCELYRQINRLKRRY